jgi:glycosyltransferase involved in cell wall biosynthesis
VVLCTGWSCQLAPPCGSASSANQRRFGTYDDQMRIAFLVTNLKASGGSRVVVQLIRGLRARGYDALAVVPTNAKVAEPNANIPLLRVGWITTGLPYIDLLSYLLTTRGQIQGFDVVIATYFYTAYPAMRSLARLQIYLVQGYDPLFCQDPASRLRNFLLYPYRRIAEASYSQSMRYICNSRWVANILRQNHEIESQVFSPGVDTSVFSPEPARPIGQPLRIVFVGRSAKYKGYGVLDEALKKLRFSGRLDFELVVVSQEQPPFSEAYPVRRVRPRNDEELAALYRSGHLLVHPAWFEGFGLPALEAMACGLPSIVTSGSAMEEFARNEVNALLVPPRDPRALADAIARLAACEELRQSIRQNGIVTARQFSWKQTVDQFEAALLRYAK